MVSYVDVLTQVIAERQGWFSRGDALRVGLTNQDLVSGVRRRQFLRLRHGAYCLAEPYETRTAAERHLLLARQSSHPSADRSPSLRPRQRCSTD